MAAQKVRQRSIQSTTNLSHRYFEKQLYRPMPVNYLYLQQAHLLSTLSNSRKYTQNNEYHTDSNPYQNISIHSFTTSPSTDNKKPKRRPLLNRFLRLFAIGPKISFCLEKSGAVVDHSLLNLISTSTALGVYAFAAVTTMSYFNIDTTPFVGLFGVGGAAIGFGMKDIANNYVCGVVMALQSLFKRGDEVTVAGSYTGIVYRMNLRHLELETNQNGDKKLVYIPNADVFGKPIIVHHKMPVTAPDAMITELEQEAEQQ